MSSTGKSGTAETVTTSGSNETSGSQERKSECEERGGFFCQLKTSATTVTSDTDDEGEYETSSEGLPRRFDRVEESESEQNIVQRHEEVSGKALGEELRKVVVEGLEETFMDELRKAAVHEVIIKGSRRIAIESSTEVDSVDRKRMRIEVSRETDIQEKRDEDTEQCAENLKSGVLVAQESKVTCVRETREMFDGKFKKEATENTRLNERKTTADHSRETNIGEQKEKFTGGMKESSVENLKKPNTKDLKKEFLDDSRDRENSSSLINTNSRKMASDKSTSFLPFDDRSTSTSLATITEIFPPIKSESLPVLGNSSCGEDFHRGGESAKPVTREVRNCASSHAREKKLRMIVARMGHLIATDQDESITRSVRDFSTDKSTTTQQNNETKLNSTCRYHKIELNAVTGVPAFQINKDGSSVIGAKETHFRDLLRDQLLKGMNNRESKVTTDGRDPKVKDESREDLIDIAENPHPSYKSFYFSPSPRESIDRPINEIAVRLEEPAPSISDVDNPGRAIDKVTCRLQGQHGSLEESDNRSRGQSRLLEESESHQRLVERMENKSQGRFGSIGESDNRSQGYRRSRTCFKDLDILLRIGGELAPLQQRLSEITGKFRALELAGMSHDSTVGRNFLHVRDYTNVHDFHTTRCYPGLPSGHSNLDMTPRHFFHQSFGFYDRNVTPRFETTSAGNSKLNLTTSFLHAQNCPGFCDKNVKSDFPYKQRFIRNLDFEPSVGNSHLNLSSNLSQQRECIGNSFVDVTSGISYGEKCIGNSDANVKANVSQDHKCIDKVDACVTSNASCDHKHTPKSDLNVKSDPWEQQGQIEKCRFVDKASFSSDLAVNGTSCLSFKQKYPVRYDSGSTTPDLINQELNDPYSTASVLHRQTSTIYSEENSPNYPLTNQNGSINPNTNSSPVITDTFLPKTDPCNSQSIDKKARQDTERNCSLNPVEKVRRRAVGNEVRLIYASSNVISGEESTSTSRDRSTSVNVQPEKVVFRVGNDPSGTFRQNVACCRETSASLMTQPGNSPHQGIHLPVFPSVKSVRVGGDDSSDNTVDSNETLKDSTCSLASNSSVQTTRNISLADPTGCQVRKCRLNENANRSGGNSGDTCVEVLSADSVGQDTCKEVPLHGLACKVESNFNAYRRNCLQGTIVKKEICAEEDLWMASVSNKVQRKTILMDSQFGTCGSCDNRQKLSQSSEICIEKRITETVNTGLQMGTELNLNSLGNPSLHQTSEMVSTNLGKDLRMKKKSETRCGDKVLTSSQKESPSTFVVGQRHPISSDKNMEAALLSSNIQNKIQLRGKTLETSSFQTDSIKTNVKPGQDLIPQRDKQRDDPVLTRPQIKSTGTCTDTRITSRMEERFPQGHLNQKTNQIVECKIVDYPSGVGRRETGVVASTLEVREEKTSDETLGRRRSSLGSDFRVERDGRAWYLDPISMGLQIHPLETRNGVQNHSENKQVSSRSRDEEINLYRIDSKVPGLDRNVVITPRDNIRNFHHNLETQENSLDTCTFKRDCFDGQQKANDSIGGKSFRDFLGVNRNCSDDCKTLFVEKTSSITSVGERRLENRVDKSVAIEVLLPQTFSKASCTSSTCFSIAHQVRRVDANTFTEVIDKTYSSRGVSPFQSLCVLDSLSNKLENESFVLRNPSLNFQSSEGNSVWSKKVAGTEEFEELLHSVQTASSGFSRGKENDLVSQEGVVGGIEKSLDLQEFEKSFSLTVDESSRYYKDSQDNSPVGQTARNANPEEFTGSYALTSSSFSRSLEFPGNSGEASERQEFKIEEVMNSVADRESLKETITDGKSIIRVMKDFTVHKKEEESSLEGISVETNNLEKCEKINSSNPAKIKVAVIGSEKSADAAINSEKLEEMSFLMKKNVLGSLEKYTNRTSSKAVYEPEALNLKARGKLIESNKKHCTNLEENGKDNAHSPEQKAMSIINSREYEKINSPNRREIGEVAVGSAESTNMTISSPKYEGAVSLTENNSLGSYEKENNDIQRGEEKANGTELYPTGREKTQPTTTKAKEIIRTRVLNSKEITKTLSLKGSHSFRFHEVEGNNIPCEGLDENNRQNRLLENNISRFYRNEKNNSSSEGFSLNDQQDRFPGNISLNAQSEYLKYRNFHEDFSSLGFPATQKDSLTSSAVIGPIPTDGSDVKDVHVKRGDNHAEVSLVRRTEDPIDAEETDRSNYSLVRNLAEACQADLDVSEERTTDNNSPSGLNEQTINRNAFTETKYANDLSGDETGECGEKEKVGGESISEIRFLDNSEFSDVNDMRTCSFSIMQELAGGGNVLSKVEVVHLVNSEEESIVGKENEKSLGDRNSVIQNVIKNCDSKESLVQREERNLSIKIEISDKNLLEENAARQSISPATKNTSDAHEMKTFTDVIPLTTEEGNAGELEQMGREKDGNPGNSANGISGREVKSRLSLQSANMVGEGEEMKKNSAKKVKEEEKEETDKENEMKGSLEEKGKGVRKENEDKKENEGKEEKTFKRSSFADKNETHPRPPRPSQTIGPTELQVEEKRDLEGADEEEKSATAQPCSRGTTIPRDSLESLLCPSGSDENEFPVSGQADEIPATNFNDRITIVPVVFANGAPQRNSPISFSKIPKSLTRPSAILRSHNTPMSSGTFSSRGSNFSRSSSERTEGPSLSTRRAKIPTWSLQPVEIPGSFTSADEQTSSLSRTSLKRRAKGNVDGKCTSRRIAVVRRKDHRDQVSLNARGFKGNESCAGVRCRTMDYSEEEVEEELSGRSRCRINESRTTSHRIVVLRRKSLHSQPSSFSMENSKSFVTKRQQPLEKMKTRKIVTRDSFMERSKESLTHLRNFSGTSATSSSSSLKSFATRRSSRRTSSRTVGVIDGDNRQEKVAERRDEVSGEDVAGRRACGESRGEVEGRRRTRVEVKGRMQNSSGTTGRKKIYAEEDDSGKRDATNRSFERQDIQDESSAWLGASRKNSGRLTGQREIPTRTIHGMRTSPEDFMCDT